MNYSKIYYNKSIELDSINICTMLELKVSKILFFPEKLELIIISDSFSGKASAGRDLKLFDVLYGKLPFYFSSVHGYSTEEYERYKNGL